MYKDISLMITKGEGWSYIGPEFLHNTEVKLALIYIRLLQVLNIYCSSQNNH